MRLIVLAMSEAQPLFRCAGCGCYDTTDPRELCADCVKVKEGYVWLDGDLDAYVEGFSEDDQPKHLTL